jgi:hypothetical protein
MRLCLAHDAARKDRILYAAATCGATRPQPTPRRVDGAATSRSGHAGLSSRGLRTGEPHRPLVERVRVRLGINFTHQGDLVFATLFTYSADGRPMWLAMPAGARQGDGDTFSGTLYRVTGSRR